MLPTSFKNKVLSSGLLFVLFAEIFNILLISPMQAATISTFLHTANHQQLLKFSREITSAELAHFLSVRHPPSANFGPFSSSFTPDANHDFLAELTAHNQRLFLPYFKATSPADKLDKIIAKKIGAMTTFAGQFATNITDDSLATANKIVNATFILWMYFYDDEITKLTHHLQSSADTARELTNEALRQANAYMMTVFALGLSGQEKIPAFSLSKITESSLTPLIKNHLEGLVALSTPLYETAKMLRDICFNPAVVKNDTAAFAHALSLYLESLLEQATSAPATPHDYLERHLHSGGVISCFNLAILLSSWHHKTSIAATIPAKDQDKIAAFFTASNLLVLKINDAMWGKDIGQPEELYYATLLGYALAQSKELKEHHPFDLTKAQGHGEIIAHYGGSKLGFTAMQELAHQISVDFQTVINLGEELTTSATNKSLALIYSQSILHWIVGYHFLNPISTRYGTSFRLYLDALRGDALSYEAEFKKLKAASSFVHFGN